jgi:hypothetical protein
MLGAMITILIGLRQRRSEFPAGARSLVAALAVLASLLASAAGCARSPLVRDLVAAGEQVDVSIDDPAGIDRWTVRTSSEQEPTILRLSGDPAVIGALHVRVLLPGDVVVAQLAPARVPAYSIALSGRAATWTVEMSLAARRPVPVQYQLAVAQPSTPAAGVGPACGDALRARGISAWVIAPPGPPQSGRLVFAGLGTIMLSATPASSITGAPAHPGAAPVIEVRDGTALSANLAELGCDLAHVQVTLWDTGKAKPPSMSIADGGGQHLCGSSGHPPCPANPAPGRWVTWTLSAAPAIKSLTIEGGQLYVSSLVIS